MSFRTSSSGTRWRDTLLPVLLTTGQYTPKEHKTTLKGGEKVGQTRDLEGYDGEVPGAHIHPFMDPRLGAGGAGNPEMPMGANKKRPKESLLSL